MKLSRTIQLKAVFLLAVFTLNTMVGFACAVGLDLGFNSKHHHHEEGTTLHHHQDNENCCNDEAVQFSQLDKLLAQVVNTGIETPVVLIHFLYQPEISLLTQPRTHISPSKKPYVSTARGIRVSIQSFQI
ncbi:hypothetical protein [Chitinophaga niabensis]|uniref:Uncharacterized protein n=1 Tax=Chitinophaga niabensis TaxID=536979 RepID=A0A1N6K3A8_9BACT|nr:hypothetical protein [Chitinophaga niabensis]SIO50913.1 hypothetical protein SAMN04488055_4974 [Chitinophaga niabensis]